MISIITPVFNGEQFIEECIQAVIRQAHPNVEHIIVDGDSQDRTVKIIEGTGWKFQADNKLPVELKPGDVINIKAKEYHRIHKGSGSLQKGRYARLRH